MSRILSRRARHTLLPEQTSGHAGPGIVLDPFPDVPAGTTPSSERRWTSRDGGALRVWGWVFLAIGVFGGLYLLSTLQQHTSELMSPEAANQQNQLKAEVAALVLFSALFLRALLAAGGRALDCLEEIAARLRQGPP